MNISKENSSEKSLEKTSGENPVSVYSVNFTQIVNNNVEKNFILKQTEADDSVEINTKYFFSKRLWRNAAVIAAILMISVVLFAYQWSVIRTEKTEIAESPVKIEPIREQTVEAIPVEIEARKKDVVMKEKAAPPVRQRQPEIAPPKPQFKKKDSVETKAARLRRAEKILTGI